MKAAWYEKNGPAKDVLIVGELPKPAAGPGEVLVRIHASGVNPSDVKVRANRALITPRIVPHSDGSGIIEEVGAGVPSARLGERVWIWNGQWKRPFGTAAEFISLPEKQAVQLPDNTSFEEGACLGVPALTALYALTTDGQVAGQSVLITGGAGSVGSYAIQMAKLLGAARIVTTVSSEAKAAVAKALGANDIVNYKTENIGDRVKAITGGLGLNRIIEVDAAANVHSLLEIIAQDGLYVVYGSGKPTVPFDFRSMIGLGVGIRFFIVYELSAEARKTCVSTLNSYLASGLLKHSVSRAFGLEDIASAHEAVESGKEIGNVVISLNA